mmetsp:Transcript_831/g.1130  ORF Transcript_831/g.1130 Transcript_831/m.1130 type:complete len:143 (-) Transcript_831:217-645(-)
MTHNKLLHHPGQKNHHANRQQDCDERWHRPAEVGDVAAKDRVDEMRERNLSVHDAHQRHGSKQGHHTLCVIKDTRRFVDQDKPKSDERIKHAGHQTVERDFHRKNQLFRHPALLLQMPLRTSAQSSRNSLSEWSGQSWLTPR